MNDEKRKLLLAILATIVFVMLIIGLLIMPSNDNQLETMGTSPKWVVQEGDTLGFETSLDSNAIGDITIVDRILSEYGFDEHERDMFGNKIIKIRATSVPQQVNFTEICQRVMNMSGPVNVEQELDGQWRSITGLILPFFIPINGWSNIKTALQAVLSENGSVYMTYNAWNGEYTFKINYILENQEHHLEYVWDKTFGTLQGAQITVVDEEGKNDSISIILSSQKVKYEETRLISLITNPSFLLVASISLILSILLIIKKLSNRGK